MTQTGLGGGLAQAQARRSHVPDSLRAIEDDLVERGYDGLVFESRDGEWVARTYTGKGQRIEVIEPTKVRAAQSLVRSITRP